MFCPLNYKKLKQYKQVMVKSKPAIKINNDNLSTEKKGMLVLGCRYDVILRVSMENNFTGVAETDCWSLCWSDIPLSSEKINDMKRKQIIGGPNSAPVQKFNHFPGMYEICRKDRLCRNLNRLRRLFPQDYDFFPSTWDLPSDMADLLEYGKRHKNITYIVKPDAGSQGKGIFLINNLKLLCPFAKCVCQLYVTQPFLMEGYKFDQRLYVVVTCVDPLRFYIHDDGIARFATVKYQMPSEQNLDVTYMHLTNYSLNKFSDAFDSNQGGTKRPLSEIYKSMGDMGYDVQKLVDDIDDIVVKTIVGVAPTLRHSYRSTYPKREKGCYCFEVLGFDILIDRHLKPMLIEVNHSPSFNLDTSVDTKVKFDLVRDLFAMIYLGEDSSEELWKSDPLIQKKYNIQRRPGTPHATIIPDALKDQFAHEEKNRNNFRLIFSEENPGKYAPFMDKEYFLKDYEDTQFLKKRLEPCMHDGFSESFLKEPSKTQTSFRHTQYGQVYVESRPSSPYPMNHHEYLKFKYNTQFTEDRQPGRFVRGRSRKKRLILDKEEHGSRTNSKSSYDEPSSDSTSKSKSIKAFEQSEETNKLSPSQRIQIALEQLRKTNVEKFKAITQTNMFKQCTDMKASLVSPVSPISPYLQSYPLLQEKLLPTSAKNTCSSTSYRPLSRNSNISDREDNVLYLDTSKLPSVFRHVVQATRLQCETTRIKSADGKRDAALRNDHSSSREILLNNCHPLKPSMDIIEEHGGPWHNSNFRKRTVGVLGIGSTAQKVVEMVASRNNI